MKRSFRTLPLVTLAALTLLSIHTAPVAAEAPPLLKNLCNTHPEAGSPELLFLRLGGGPAAGAAYDRIEIQVTLDGQPFLTEELELRGDAEATPGVAPVVELLAWHPQELGILFREARKDPERVRFRIAAEGLPAIDLGWSELLAHSRGLLAEGFRPQPVTSTVELAAGAEDVRALAASVVYCDTCIAQYQLCQANSCQAELPPRLCDRCDTQYFACLDTCVPRPCEVTTEIVYESWPLYEIAYLHHDCYWDVFNPRQGHEFNEQMWMWKKVKKQITQNADCTETETVLEVTYYQDYCYQRLFLDCCAYPDSCMNQYPSVHNRRNSCWY